VASELGIARTTLVAIEAGDREARPEELIALAALYRTSVNALLRRSKVDANLVGQFRRSVKSGADDSIELESLRLLERLATSFAELEARLGMAPAFDYPRERPLVRGRLDRQAEDLASEFRSLLGIGIQPIKDIFGLAELELGIRLFVRALPKGVSGVFAFAPEIGACVILNRNHPRTRRRWTLAHELAHFLTSRNAAVVDMEGPPHRDFERFADLFAGAFLMPGPAVRRMFTDFVAAEDKFSARHLILLAHRFGVSLEAMGRRLEQLHLLRSGTFEVLRDRGLNQSMVEAVLGRQVDEWDDDVPARMALLGAEAFHKGFLSEEQLAEMLALDRVATRTLLDALGDEEEPES
jgi:Zn-dependent peptidase ImmA (M78 family)